MTFYHLFVKLLAMFNIDDRTRYLAIIEYHERTKHYPDHYARSPGFLDWANQPVSFRRYEGTILLELPFIEKDQGVNYFALFDRKVNKSQPFSLKSIGAFLELSMGLSAWKSFGGSSWALRINPSSGNLHPTEAHLILPPLPENDNQGGVFHYNPFSHALELRAGFDGQLWSKIRGHSGIDGFLVGVSSIYWREAWKYGERAFRYCQLDAGHAMACLSFSANLLGWRITYLNALSNEDIDIVLGFNKTPWKEFERENGETLFFIHSGAEKLISKDIPPEIIQEFESRDFTGEPNQLSTDHVDWDIIDKVSSMTVKPKTPEKTYHYKDHDFFEKEIPLKGATEIIRQRRSGQAYDGKTSIHREHFFAMLDKTMPRNHSAPFDLALGEISIHLLIFIHRVSGLEPGLYFLIRDERDLDAIKDKCHRHFLWERVKEAPDMLLLYLLKRDDFRDEATFISCQQDIAGDGAFSLGMIAIFRENIEKHPYLYRQLFWEAGMIGQVLYLEAEAHSVRGTGIGCFFDEPVHEMLGFSDNTYQDLYHFTVGRALEDMRLTTLPPYEHLKR